MTQHSQTAHEHAQLIRQLEHQGHIFAQTPKLVTQTLLSAHGTAHDKLFLRAKKIDSDGCIMGALIDAKHSIVAGTTAVYVLYFVMALVGVMGLLAATTVNFFYLIVALLGWHTLSLLWWCASILTKRRATLLSVIFDKISMANTLVNKSLKDDKRLRKTAFLVLNDIQKPVTFWYISSILHTAWLFGLLGSVVGLLMLFLFKSYQFHWESTLLSEAQFYQLLGIIGFVPAKFGITLPDGIHSSPAQFAWLTIASLMLYGFFPRLLACMYSHIKARTRFKIDTQDPYFAKLLTYYSQAIIDQDDYQAPKAKPLNQATISDRLIIAALEKPNHAPLWLSYLHDFGCVDGRDDITRLLTQADQLSAQICLIISIDTVPDRGILRKIERIGKHSFGMVVVLSGDDQSHLTAWQFALTERNIPLVEHLPA